MKSVKRFDTIRIDKIERMPETGFIRFPCYAGRTGIQRYRDSQGNAFYELRPPEEVFSDKTLATLKGAPFTNNHPKDFVTIKNAKELMVGFCGETIERIKYDSLEYQKIDVTITDGKTIEDIEKGKVEVSLGYNLELEETKGTFQGQNYDAIQRNIKINHLALVDKARGGDKVRLRLDTDEAITDNVNQLEDKQMKVKFGDREFDVNDELGKLIVGMQKKQADMSKELDAYKNKKSDSDNKKVDELQAKIDHLETELSKAKDKANKLDSETFKNELKTRRSIEKIAEKTLNKELIEKLDDMDNLEIKKAIIKAETPNVNLDEKSETYVNARYDHIVDIIDVSSEKTKELGDKVVNDRKEKSEKAKQDDNSELEKKRLESQKKDSEAWMRPTETMKVKN